ncbi:GDSL-type esterase/lipase family protein [Sphingomonas kyeonggiensis]|uniref:Chitooligosaccharide deacetylase n=1 Tax=Sphingomonas kyeonggiensis TaxID=1268553 RepID=A0A7W6JSH4_9SPHN|nr:GDSL-type esterase/lipase family protein [Sphingomonas kyeonggiensis]MBB4097637.1 lysophospholipase L1-like esterase/peptidoglycan/xylan/chitin deacetylase (PgdA/CDA1 family) [Sphingomonas kyeonggiensis]
MGLIARLLALVLLLGAAATPGERWVTAWATSQMIPGNNALPSEDLKDATIRQIVRIQIAGTRLRVRLTNAYGTQSLRIGSATIAHSADPATAKIDPASLTGLRFGGAKSVTIPAGADYWSDPITLPVKAGADLAVTLYLPEAPAQQTGHPGSRATSHMLHGDHSGDADLPGAKTADRWVQIGAIETVSAKASAVVILGDSITDGYGVSTNSNTRWTDALQRRLRATPALADMAVLNAGIGGNRLLNDGLGPNAMARFEREVLSYPGVSHLVIFEGVNDLGTLTRDAPATPEAHAALVEGMIGAYRQMVARARAHGIKVIGATITPYGGSAYYHPDAQNEADRAAVNAWIRAPGNFDGVIDFDAAMRDPAAPIRLLKAFDNDGLHPSVAGYQVMADAVPLSLFSDRVKDKGRVATAPAAPAPMIAFTFDDLTAHAPLPQGYTRVGIAEQIIAALKAGGAPATGFINGVQLEREPASAPVLDKWRGAGLMLGNHGWSHANLNDLSDAQFLTELEKNEPILKAKMGAADWRWFRYPFLSEASADPAKRTRVRKLLAARGYKVAAVTMDFSDWAYNDTYARCVARGDTDAILKMEHSWLGNAAVQADRSRAMAQALYGRDIPYVLLMHLGAFDAHMMPRLIALYREKGYRFVSIEEAEKDPYYVPELNPALAPQPQGLNGAMAAKGLKEPQAPALLPLETMCM